MKKIAYNFPISLFILKI